VAISTMTEHEIEHHSAAPILLLGYGQVAEPAIRAGVRAIAEAVRATRPS
jgi:hypothetical protein